MIASADLTEICQQLVRDSAGRKVLVCSADGVEGAATGARVPATKDLVASLPGGLPGGLSACATSIGSKAALVVIFDGRTATLDRVRLKVRRARDLIAKSLPLEPTAEKPSSH